METGPNNQRKALITFVAVLIVVAVIVAAVAASPKKQKTATTNSNTATTAGSTSTTNTSTSSSNYKDGNYSATGSYTSPGGTEEITIQVTLKNGVITDTSATSGARDVDAKEYQGDFIKGYKSQVVGKSINSVNLSRVSGSSLTSQGFNEAISQIKSEAQA